METTKRKYKKKPDFNTVAGKLFLQQQSGKTDAESARALNISPQNVPNLEKTSTYIAIQKKFADTLLDKITIAQLSDELIKNIVQDTDKGAKNNALKIAMDKIEPDNNVQQAQQVNIVLK